MTQKICTRCLREQPLTEFHNHSYSKDGLSNECKSCRRERAIEYDRNNKETKKKAFKRWYELNKETLQAKKKDYYRDYYRLHAEEKIAKARKWVQDNPEKARENSRRRAERRIARKNALIYDLTVEQWERTLDVFDFRCAYCGIDSGKLQQEHFIPVLMGGGYTLGNIIPACHRCNVRKGSKDPKDWLAEDKYGEIQERIAAITG